MINYDMLKVVTGLGNAGGTVINKLITDKPIYVNCGISHKDSFIVLKNLLESNKFDIYKNLDVISSFYIDLISELIFTSYEFKGPRNDGSPLKTLGGVKVSPSGYRGNELLSDYYRSLSYYITLVGSNPEGGYMLPSFKLLLEELIEIIFPSKVDDRISSSPSFHTLDYHVNKIFNDTREIAETKDFKNISSRSISSVKLSNVTSIYSTGSEFCLLLNKLSPEELFKLLLAIQCNVLATRAFIKV